MALLTVDDLARDLKVKNEDLLRELATLGYQVEGPDSHLETDDPGALRDILVTALPQREIVEKRIRPTVIRRRMKKQPPAAKEEAPIEVAAFTEPVVEVPAVAEPETPATEKEGKISEEAVGRPKTEPPRRPKKKARKMEPARIIEMPPPKPPVEKVPLQPLLSKAATEGKHEELAGVRGEIKGPHARPAPSEATATTPAELVEPVEAKAPVVKTAEAKEERAAEDRFAKKKKKKERKMQPAQIIGRIDLRKEPPRQAEAPLEPPPTRTPRIVEPAAAAPEPFPLESVKEEDKRKKRKKDKKGREPVEEVTEEAKGLSYEALKNRVTTELKKLFRPEFLNRVDEVIVFHDLTHEEILQIVDLMVARLREQLYSQGMDISLAEEARDLLAKEGFDPALGARPLRRAIQRFLEDPLSEQMLAGQWQAGDVIEAYLEDEGLSFRKGEGPVSVPTRSGGSAASSPSMPSRASRSRGGSATGGAAGA